MSKSRGRGHVSFRERRGGMGAGRTAQGQGGQYFILCAGMRGTPGERAEKGREGSWGTTRPPCACALLAPRLSPFTFLVQERNPPLRFSPTRRRASCRVSAHAPARRYTTACDSTRRPILRDASRPYTAIAATAVASHRRTNMKLARGTHTWHRREPLVVRCAPTVHGVRVCHGTDVVVAPRRVPPIFASRRV